MKILRSITRRGYSVGTAGYFSVLKPNTWFPATRLPGRFRYRAQVPGTGQAADGVIAPPRIMVPGAADRSPMRLALVVLAAMAITSALLWWIMHP